MKQADSWTREEVDKLVAEKYELGAYGINLRSSLGPGVLAFCIFVDRELVHINCITDNPRSKNILDLRPFPVDFSKGDVVGGRAITVPKFRRLGFRKYTGYQLRKYLHEKGYVRSIGTLGVNNYPALANTARNVHTRIIAKRRYLRILGISYVKETVMEPTPAIKIIEQMSQKK